MALGSPTSPTPSREISSDPWRENSSVLPCTIKKMVENRLGTYPIIFSHIHTSLASAEPVIHRNSHFIRSPSNISTRTYHDRVCISPITELVTNAGSRLMPEPSTLNTPKR